MIVDEVIPRIDEEYPTRAEASARAVAGFSMGGAGAVRLAILHLNLFCVASSWGGALSRRGSGEDSPLLPAAKAGAEKLTGNNFALLTINGDQDHPKGFLPLHQVLTPLGITHKMVTLPGTKHNLGQRGGSHQGGRGSLQEPQSRHLFGADPTWPRCTGENPVGRCRWVCEPLKIFQ